MEHIKIVNGNKFTANLVGGQAINGKSVLSLTKSSTSPEIAISFMEIRLANINNKSVYNDLDYILDEVTDADDLIDMLLMEDNLSNEEFIAKIERSLKRNKNDTTDKLADKIRKNCKSQLLSNITKRRNKHRKIIEVLLNESEIQNKLSSEKTIKLVLDNFKPHKSKFIEKIAEMLNIDLIFLPIRSPHLNPIEQVWRLIKAEVRMLYIENQAHLEQIITMFFSEKVNEISIDKWIETYIN